MGAPKAPKPPAPTAEERALQSAQTQLLQQQRDISQAMWQQQQAYAPTLERLSQSQLAAQEATLAEQQEAARQEALLRPMLLQQQGYREIRDPTTGQITGYAELPEFAARRAQQQTIESALAERSAAALGGRLPVDPALERNLAEQRAQLGESLRQQLGSGWETSTPGQQALAEYTKRAEELRAGARTGALTLAEQLGLARQAANREGAAGTIGGLTGLVGSPFQRQYAQTMMAPALGFNAPGAFGNVAAGYGSQAQLLASRRMAGYSGAAGGSPIAGALMGGMSGAMAGGALGGALAGGTAGSVVPGFGTAIGAGLGLIGGYLSTRR